MPLSNHDDLVADAVARLMSGANKDRSFDAAQMQLINLPEIISRAGPHWEKLKHRIRIGSMNFLKGCLGDDDVVIPAGDGFLIIFADQRDMESQKMRAAELRDLLLEFYLGEEELKRLKVHVAQYTISSEDLGELMAPPPTPATEATTLSCLFAPIWTAQGNAIVSYTCMPVQRDGDGPRYGYDAGYAKSGVNDNRSYCELDVGLLDVVESALKRYGANDARPAIGTSIHSTTMQNRNARSAVLDRLARIPESERHYLFVKIAEIEPGAPIINISDWVGTLRSRVKHVMLEFHHSETSAPNLQQIAVWGAGYQAPLTMSPDGADLPPHVRQFRRWGHALALQRLRFFIDNVRQPGLIRLAAEAGARFITSDKLWPFQKWPGGVVKAAGPDFSPFPQP